MKKTFYLILLCLAYSITGIAQEYLYVNGEIIPVENIKSIKSSYRVHPNALSNMLENDETSQVFTDALNATGVMKSLVCYVDDTYGWATDQDRIDSCTWTNNRLCVHVAAEYDNVAYPEKRYFNHTIFVCKDEILKTKYGITDLNGLRKLAKQLYDPMYPEDANITDETDSRNSLNRFIAYHILNRYGSYYTLTSNDNFKLPYNFRRNKYDICDYYETMMPHSLMKFSFPSGSQAGLYINRRGVQSRPDSRGVFVRGAKVYPPSEPCVNGAIMYIDDVIAYDETTQKVVLDENIRVDASTLSPDFMTLLSDGETARGHSAINPGGDNNKYGKGGQGANALTNSDHCIGFKPGYTRNISFDNDTHLHVRGRVLNYWSYEADEVNIKGKFKVKVKLPPVPAGTYEIRISTCTGFVSRGIVAFSIDGKATDIVDLRPGGRTLFGNEDRMDYNKFGNDPESIVLFDNSAHNRGWMRGPKCYMPGNRSSSDYSLSSMRDLSNTIRRVVGVFTTTGKEDHYLEIQQLMDSQDCELNLDFIELVPSSVYDNDYYPEDVW